MGISAADRIACSAATGKQQGENRSKEEIIYPLLLLINISCGRGTSTSQQWMKTFIATALITRIYLYIISFCISKYTLVGTKYK